MGKDELQLISIHLKREIKLYNNLFQVTETFKPTKEINKKYVVRDCIEIQYKNAHYVALV